MPSSPTKKWQDLGFSSEADMVTRVAEVKLGSPAARSSFLSWKKDAASVPEGAAARLERLKAHLRPALHYEVKGPTLLSFSGGRTSGFLLHQLLATNDGVLPEDCKVVFTNTGMERNETLDFVDLVGREWGVDIHWVEYVPPARLGDEPKHFTVRRVTHETAFRLDESPRRPDGTVRPFDGLLEALAAYRREKKGQDPILPGIRYRLCTSFLKIKTSARYCREVFGWDHWETLLGLRADEPERVASAVMAETENGYDRYTPLADDGVTEADVMAFWASNRFDLQLLQGEGNCSLCYLKSVPKLLWLMRRRPDLAAWWLEAEERAGQQFNKDRTFKKLAERAAAMTEAQIEELERQKIFPASVPCTCTD